MNFNEIIDYCKKGSDPIIYRESWEEEIIDGRPYVKVLHMLESDKHFELFYQSVDNKKTNFIDLDNNYKFTNEDIEATDWEYAL